MVMNVDVVSHEYTHREEILNERRRRRRRRSTNVIPWATDANVAEMAAEVNEGDRCVSGACDCCVGCCGCCLSLLSKAPHGSIDILFRTILFFPLRSELSL